MGQLIACCNERNALRKVNLAAVSRRTFKGRVGHLVRLKTIYDGDTFTVVTRLHRGEPFFEYSIRLAGLDAPEVKPAIKGTPHRELHKKAGLHVRDLLRAELPIGSLLMVDFDKEEKYGRLMGRIWTVRPRFCGLVLVRDKDLTAELLRARCALSYGGGSKEAFDQAFLSRVLRVKKVLA